MLWASDELGRDGKPAVLLLSTTRTHATITAEAAYVAAELAEGWQDGRYYPRGGEGIRLRVWWPGGWPAVGTSNKLHPRVDTPEEALALGEEGQRVLRFTVWRNRTT